MDINIIYQNHIEYLFGSMTPSTELWINSVSDAIAYINRSNGNIDEIFISNPYGMDDFVNNLL